MASGLIFLESDVRILYTVDTVPQNLITTVFREDA